MARTTSDILQHHLSALGAQDIEAVVSDYTDDAVLLLPDGPVRGRDALRDFFTSFLKTNPGLVDAIKLSRQDIEGEVAYIVWTAPGFLALGTDTFVMRDGSIAVQTFAAHPAS